MLRDKLKQQAAPFVQRLISRLRLQSRAAGLKQEQQLHELEAEFDELNNAVTQLRSTIQEMGGLLPPPTKLQKRVICRGFERFIENGLATVRDFDRILEPTGRSLKSFESIFDFGAGCARILRPLRSYVGPSAKLYATDIDTEAMQWCQRNYASLAVFEINEPWPPLKHSDDSFDFVYCMSVFTHLPEDMQFKWLQELNRLVKPDGYLILTTHGEFYYDRISLEHRRELEAKGFLHFNNGLTEGLPEFYLTTFHTHDYIRSRWADYLEIVNIESRAILGAQDAVLCRKKN
jgi:SAM-dependent methyltransferase